jgi:hypothetical protein
MGQTQSYFLLLAQSRKVRSTQPANLHHDLDRPGCETACKLQPPQSLDPDILGCLPKLHPLLPVRVEELEAFRWRFGWRRVVQRRHHLLVRQPECWRRSEQFDFALFGTLQRLRSKGPIHIFQRARHDLHDEVRDSRMALSDPWKSREEVLCRWEVAKGK